MNERMNEYRRIAYGTAAIEPQLFRHREASVCNQNKVRFEYSYTEQNTFVILITKSTRIIMCVPILLRVQSTVHQGRSQTFGRGGQRGGNRKYCF